MTRSTRAIGDRYVWQSPEKHKEKWLAEARRSVDAKLERGVEVVPCPCCGWIQSRMLRRARTECFPVETRPGVFAFILAGVALLLMVVLYHVEQAFNVNWVTGWLGLIATAILMAGCGTVCVIRQELRARRFDPNSTPAEERIDLGRQRALSWEQFQSLYPAEARIQTEEARAVACRTETSA
jgi:hypothetical protein